MRIKTFFKTLIPLKTFLLILMCILFSSVLLAQAETASAPCGTDEAIVAFAEGNPGYLQAFEDTNQQITDAINQNPGMGGQLVQIPVVVHIMHNETAEVNENISDQQVFDAIDELNAQFAGPGVDLAGHPFDATTNIRFTLAKIDPDGNCTNGIVRVETDKPFVDSSDPTATDLILKNQSRWDTEKYLNIWVVEDANGANGYVTPLPITLAGDPFITIPERDGIVIRFDRFGNTGEAINNTQNTLSHEAGHYLFLLHPWQNFNPNFSNCERDCHAPNEGELLGDRVPDTNPCIMFIPVFPVDCNQDYAGQCQTANCANGYPNVPHPKETYMSYSSACHTGFSQGQSVRMHASIAVARPDLVSPANLLNTGINLIFPPQQDVTISQNTTWGLPNVDADRGAICIDGTVTIESGATLTVAPGVIVMFAHHSTVIVEPGARLIMDGSTFTSCDTWEGIQVLGNNNQGQAIANQGFVYMSGATIEHAEVGVHTGERTLGSPVVGTTGGIIRADRSTFRDNQVDMEFWSYKNTHPVSGSEINNASNFRNCVSLLTDAYRFPFDDIDTELGSFILMNGVNGIAIRGHHFEDQRTIINLNRPSGKIGIASSKAGFSVDERCTGPLSLPPPSTCNGNRTSFVNLGYGIHSRSLSNNPSFSIRIRNSDFDCWHGIYTRTVNDLAIELNNFNVKRQIIPELPGNLPDWSVVPSYGIHLDNCTGYIVQQNDLISEFQFGSPTSGDETAGIVVRNNHGGGEQIYNNNFRNFSVACEGVARNRSGGNPSEEVGLEFRCNNFTDGRVDIFVSPEVNPNLPQATINGILPTQNLPANLFSPANTALGLHIWNLPGAAPITYNHYNPANEPRVVPTLVNNSVNVMEEIFEAYNDITTCPDLLSNGSGMGIDDGIITLTGIKNVKNNLIQTELGTLQTLTDNGNTTLLLAAVNHPNPQRSFQAYTNILSQAPFTSDEVLEAVSKKESGWSIGMVRNVLSAHPQAAKSTIIQENLDNRTHRLHPFMRNQINEGFAVISEKEQMELDISKYKRERNLAINQAVQLLASDTINRTSDMIDFYSNTGDIQYEYRLAEVYDALGYEEKAEDVLMNIDARSEAEIQAHNDYMDFRKLMQEWTIEDKNLFDLSEADIDELRAFTRNANTTAGKAITLLELNGVDTYKEPVYFPSEMELEDRSIEVYEEEDISTNRLLIYPNPADEYVVIEYALTESSHDISLVVTNTKGQVIYNEQLGYVQDELIIITDKFPIGQYFCTIYNRGNILKTDKFLLVR